MEETSKTRLLISFTNGEDMTFSSSPKSDIELSDEDLLKTVLFGQQINHYHSAQLLQNDGTIISTWVRAKNVKKLFGSFFPKNTYIFSTKAFSRLYKLNERPANKINWLKESSEPLLKSALENSLDKDKGLIYLLSSFKSYSLHQTSLDDETLTFILIDENEIEEKFKSKEKRIDLRLNDEEKALLKDLAKKTGTSMKEVILDAVREKHANGYSLEKECNKLAVDIERLMLSHCNRIGFNGTNEPEDDDLMLKLEKAKELLKG